MFPFNEIDFGKARAELEGAATPILLEKGYLDTKGIVPRLREGPKFLVLGYKGSGKSAIAEKLKLESDSPSETMTTVLHLGDFPFNSFKNILPGQAEAETKYPLTWSWLLLLLILDSFSKDHGAGSAKDGGFVKSIAALRQEGFLPTESIRRLVMRSSKKTFRIQLPKVIEYATEEQLGEPGVDLQLFHLVDHLKGLVKRFETTNKHLLVLDGLDDILLSREIQYQALAALIFEVDRLNLEFLTANSAAKILVLCRTDLYERLPGPNKNKIRQDSAYELDWYHDPRQPRDSGLLTLINLRGSLSCGEEMDVFQQYFPVHLNPKPTPRFLLEHTRHTPRDFIQLMNHLKPYWKGGVFHKNQILSGLSDYSRNYFFPEIRDELVGYVSEQRFSDFMKVFGSLRTKEVSYSKLSALALREENFGTQELDATLNALFECSAIGNKWQRDAGVRYMFRYRNRNAVANFGDTLVIHSGLWSALNLR